MIIIPVLIAAGSLALTAPAEASVPALDEATVAAECPAGFELRHILRFYAADPMNVGPGDVNGDGWYCSAALAGVRINIDNRLRNTRPWTKPGS